MEIRITLKEAFDRCDWDLFCLLTDMSEWAAAEGGGDVVVTLTEEQAKELGLIKEQPKWTT